MARIKVNDACNLCTDEHSNAYASYGQAPAPEITVPSLKLRFSIRDAHTLSRHLLHAVREARGERLTNKERWSEAIHHMLEIVNHWNDEDVEREESRQRLAPDDGAAEHKVHEIAADHWDAADDGGADAETPVGVLIEAQHLAGEGHAERK